jgi:hypothetical protein
VDQVHRRTEASESESESDDETMKGPKERECETCE